MHRSRFRVEGPSSKLLSVMMLVVAFVGTPVAAQEAFQINAYTTYYQTFPRIAADDAGRFLVVWTSGHFIWPGPDGSNVGVQARLFDPSGDPIGGEFGVNEVTGGAETASSVAMNGDGSFVVGWTHNPDPIYGQYPLSARMRRFDSSGGPIGGEIEITEESSSSPWFNMDDDGRFLVVWSGGEGLKARRYDVDATPLSDEFNIVPGEDFRGYSLDMQSDGTMVMVWSRRVTNTNSNIIGQRLTSDGTKIGSDFQVNTTTVGYSRGPDVAFVGPDEDFLVTWSRFPGGGRQILSQRYASDGSTLGEEIQINTYNTDYQRGASILEDESTGDYLVMWTRSLLPGSPEVLGPHILARRFDAAGGAVGGEFQISLGTEGYDRLNGRSAVFDADGVLTAVWGIDIPNTNIFGRRFSSGIFSADFETGDTTGWTQTVP